MDNIKIMEIDKESYFLDQVESLFTQLYDYMNTVGLLMPLVEGGEKIWRESVEKTIGRFAVLLVAINEDRVVAFAHGQIRFAPKFLGDLKVGFVSHIFVAPDFRSKGIGDKLLVGLEKWFKKQNARSYELQVLFKNDQSIIFFEKNGYKKELLQMRKEIL